MTTDRPSVKTNPEPAVGMAQPQPRSLLDLASRINEPAFDEVRAYYRVPASSSTRMLFDEAGWSAVSVAFGSDRDAIEKQEPVFVQSRHLTDEAVWNPFRARRPARGVPADAAAIVDRELIEKGCPLCDRLCRHVSQRGPLRKEFGEVVSADGCFRVLPNWARLSTVSAMSVSDELAHNLFRLTESDFSANGIQQGREHRPNARYFVCFLNGGGTIQPASSELRRNFSLNNAVIGLEE